MPYLTIYHKNCPDGLAAAVAVRQWLWDNRRMRGAKFQTAQYGDTPPWDLIHPGTDVIIVDFSYDRDTLLTIKELAASVLVIDHHETAQANLEGLEFCIFDMDKSGAVLTWEHFHPGKPIPLLMQYVQDRDLWRWELPFSREVSAGLAMQKPFLDIWANFLDDAAIPLLIGQGGPIVNYQNRHIDRATYNEPEMIEIAGYTVPVLNTTILISEIGERLSKDHPFVAMYFDLPDKRVFSLRSAAPDGVNVAEIAAQFGGGGHKHAAGFSVEKPAILLEGSQRE